MIRTGQEQSNFKRMQLAFRTSTLTTDEESLFLQARSFHVKILAAVPLAMALGAAVAFFGLASSLQVACLLGLAVFAYRAWHRRPGAVKLLVLMTGGIVGVYVLGSLLEVRIIGALLLSAATLYVFRRYGRAPLDFYQEWLLADRRLSPDARAELSPTDLRPSSKVIAGCLLISVVVPTVHTVSFALLLLVTFLVGMLWYFVSRDGQPVATLKQTFAAARHIHLQYLGYPNGRTVIWSPSESQRRRHVTFACLWALPALTLAVSLSYCMPWEIFAAHFQPDFFLRVPRFDAGSDHAWLLRPFLSMAGADRNYLWVVLIGASLCMVLPYAILFVAYLPAVLRAVEADAVVEAMSDGDEDGDFERFVSRVTTSRRVD